MSFISSFRFNFHLFLTCSMLCKADILFNQLPCPLSSCVKPIESTGKDTKDRREIWILSLEYCVYYSRSISVSGTVAASINRKSQLRQGSLSLPLSLGPTSSPYILSLQMTKQPLILHCPLHFPYILPTSLQKLPLGSSTKIKLNLAYHLLPAATQTDKQTKKRLQAIRVGVSCGMTERVFRGEKLTNKPRSWSQVIQD